MNKFRHVFSFTYAKVEKIDSPFWLVNKLLNININDRYILQKYAIPLILSLSCHYLTSPWQASGTVQCKSRCQVNSICRTNCQSSVNKIDIESSWAMPSKLIWKSSASINLAFALPTVSDSVCKFIPLHQRILKSDILVWASELEFVYFSNARVIEVKWRRQHVKSCKFKCCL